MYIIFSALIDDKNFSISIESVCLVDMYSFLFEVVCEVSYLISPARINESLLPDDDIL